MGLSVSNTKYFPTCRQFQQALVGGDFMEKTHPDAHLFMKSNNLFGAYVKFGWKVSYHHDEPEFLFKGTYLPWSQIKKELFPEGSKKYVLPHGYIFTEFEGITEQNGANWTELKPIFKDRLDPRPGKVFIEIVTNGNFFNRHAYINLIDKESKVMQVGFCGKINALFPFRNQKGKLMSPDPWGYRLADVRRTRIELTEEQFTKIKNRIETDQRTKNLHFNLLTRNCTAYVGEILREIGLKVHIQEYPEQILARVLFNSMGITIPKKLLKGLHVFGAFIRYILLPVYSLFIYILGAKYTDAKMKKVTQEHSHEWVKQPRAPFSSTKKTIMCQDINLFTGWKLLDFQNWVRRSRVLTYEKVLKEFQEASLTKELTKEEEARFEERLFSAMYALPPKDPNRGLALRPRPALLA